LSPAVKVVLDADHEIILLVNPHKGDAWTRLARRVTGDAGSWKALAELNRMGENLMTDRAVRVPFGMLRPELQHSALGALFPEDKQSEKGWSHKVVAGGLIEGESLWKIAEWFTGDGANYAAIRAANPSQTLSTRRGEWVHIPQAILSPAFAPPAAATQIAEDDPAEESDAETRGRGDAEKEAIAASPRPRVPVSGRADVPASGREEVELDYQRAGDRPYAIYKLQRGEALYSSVVIRFTGRLFARDVNEAVDQIVAFNGIADVARLPVGYPVRIPMELLSAEHRPLDDPRRIEYERARQERARFARRVKARNLEGVRVIIDAGHGGRDVGTVHQGLWESIYVYDIACRLKTALEKKTAAKVYMTTRSLESGYRVVEKNILQKQGDHVVLTTPRYILDNPVVGVNLRWYLANSIFRKALGDAVPAEKVIFVSLHADSLHPSLRGAMAYIPGNRLIQGSYTKTQQVYLARAEVQEHPTVTQTEEEALQAEALSAALARSVIQAFTSARLNVHPFSPVRDNVVRGGREWVPAVIRYNKVPTRLLLEIGNLANEEDRRLVKTRKFRQEVAGAIHAGIVDYFVNQAEGTGEGVIAASN
jgi:N-acetylmuramoyl-L-alanine amidase